MPRRWLRAAIFNFFLAACLGVLLRLAFVQEVSGLNYRFVLHGHSHVAILGWVYLALYALLIDTFLPAELHRARRYQIVFGLTQLSVFGMLVAFPIQGYAGWSIAFSTVHVVLSYAFIWFFFRDLRHYVRETSYAVRFIKTALILLLLSTLALIAMPPVMIMGLKNDPIYYMSVQFYLHFQFNGWFVFAILGLLFKWMEDNQIRIDPRYANYFFWLLLTSTLLTYALAVTWSTPLPVIFLINSVGVLLQLAALVFFVLIMRSQYPQIRSRLKGWKLFLLKVGMICFMAKIIMLGLAVFPNIATVANTIRNFVIGFIHLMLLGMATHFILGYAGVRSLLDLESRVARLGIAFLFAGFIGSELVLFLQGTLFWAAMGFLPYYYETLLLITTLMPIGIGLIFWQGVKRSSASKIHSELLQTPL